jgi:plastocyanin
MRKGSKRIAALVSVAMLAAALVGTAGTARAQAELNVLNGFPLFEAAQGAPADGMRFYAPELNVHQGDVINFQWAGFHTATLLPAGEDAEAWVAENASEFGDPYFAVLEDPDDTGLDPGSSAAKPAVKFNAHNILLPSDFTCGAAGNPCSYDGSAIVNSGLPLAEDAEAFSVSIDATPNTSFWVICLLHPSEGQRRSGRRGRDHPDRDRHVRRCSGGAGCSRGRRSTQEAPEAPKEEWGLAGLRRSRWRRFRSARHVPEEAQDP